MFRFNIATDTPQTEAHVVDTVTEDPCRVRGLVGQGVGYEESGLASSVRFDTRSQSDCVGAHTRVTRTFLPLSEKELLLGREIVH